MIVTRRSQATVVRISLLSAALCMLLFVFLIRDRIMIQYYVWRLGLAPTFRRAEPFLHSILNERHQMPIVKALVEHLGPSNQKFTFWFFCSLDSGIVKYTPVMKYFSNELETNDRLAYYWSHFVRWRLGVRINLLLDGLMTDNGPLAQVWVYTFHPDPVIAKLRQYGILWFLGLTPAPRLESGDFALYLRRSLLFLHELTYDHNQGRCVANREGSPALKTFSQLG